MLYIYNYTDSMFQIKNSKSGVVECSNFLIIQRNYIKIWEERLVLVENISYFLEHDIFVTPILWKLALFLHNGCTI